MSDEAERTLQDTADELLRIANEIRAAPSEHGRDGE